MHSVTGATGARPNFLGIGVAKAGTTSVAILLATHPEISFPVRGGKELHFFDYAEKMTSKGIEDYLSCFEPARAVGEWTPSYIMTPGARDRIEHVLGRSARFLVALRNPVDRAYSHYWHAIKNWGDPKYRELGYPVEDLSFEAAIEAEPERLANDDFHVRHQSYFLKGLYADQLEHYFERFPRENFHIHILEDYVESPARVLRDICSFLGVDPEYPFKHVDKVRNAQTEDSMAPATRSMLIERYRSSIERLERILGRDLSMWLKG